MEAKLQSQRITSDGTYWAGYWNVRAGWGRACTIPMHNIHPAINRPGRPMIRTIQRKKGETWLQAFQRTVDETPRPDTVIR